MEKCAKYTPSKLTILFAYMYCICTELQTHTLFGFAHLASVDITNIQQLLRMIRRTPRTL